MIIKSQTIDDRPQRDGRRSVIQRHEHADGSVEIVGYIIAADADADAELAIRAAAINRRDEDAKAVAPEEKRYTVTEITAAYKVKVADGKETAFLAELEKKPDKAKEAVDVPPIPGGK